MSLLTVCQNVASEVGLYNPPAFIIGSTLDDVIKLLALANRTGKEIMRYTPWQNLMTEQTITTADATEGYDLPSDYDRIVPNTFWDNTNNREVRLSTAEQWAYFKNGIVAASDIQRYWRQRADQILIYPTPSSVDTLKYEYINNKYVVNSAGDTTYNEFQADTDTVLFPEYVLELGMVYRVKKQNGLASADEKDAYEQALKIEAARNGGEQTITRLPRVFPFVNIQDGNFPSS